MYKKWGRGKEVTTIKVSFVLPLQAGRIYDQGGAPGALGHW